MASLSNSDLFRSCSRALELLIEGIGADLKEDDTEEESALKVVQAARRDAAGTMPYTIPHRSLCDGQFGTFTWWDKEEW